MEKQSKSLKEFIQKIELLETRKDALVKKLILLLKMGK